MTLAIIMVVLGSTIWLAVDANQRDWSQAKFWKSTESWVIGCLLLWVVVFPVYIAKRGSAPLKSDTGPRPVERLF
jgi:uncharacterized membrane protein